MDRQAEIRALLEWDPAEVIARAGGRLVVCENLPALHRRFAEDLFRELAASAAEDRPLNLIVPVGPSGQYPILAGRLNREKISLAHCRLFFMDEYCDAAGNAVPPDHPLSLRGTAHRLFLGRLDKPCEQVYFPDENNIGTLAQTIDEAGGIDVCYGGIGIHGHIAFNEPAPGVSAMGPRRVRLNDFTVTMNAIRAHAGGNLENFPRQAFTLGMKQILGARQIRLYCRNGCELDWANTVLRLALFGTPGDDYPATHIRDRNYVITTDRQTLASPETPL